jgi:hypothetical protein
VNSTQVLRAAVFDLLTGQRDRHFKVRGAAAAGVLRHGVQSDIYCAYSTTLKSDRYTCIEGEGRVG